MAPTLKQINIAINNLLLLLLCNISYSQENSFIVQNPFLLNVYNSSPYLFDNDSKLLINHTVWDIDQNKIIKQNFAKAHPFATINTNTNQIFLDHKNQLIRIEQTDQDVRLDYYNLTTGEKILEQQANLKLFRTTSQLYTPRIHQFQYPYMLVREFNNDKNLGFKEWVHLVDFSQEKAKTIKTFPIDHTKGIHEYYFDPSAEFLFRSNAQGDDLFVEIFELPNLQPIAKINVTELMEKYGNNYNFTPYFIPQKNWQILNWDYAGLSIINYKTKKVIANYYSENEFTIQSISPNGQYLVGLEKQPPSEDAPYGPPSVVKIIEIATGKLINKFEWKYFKGNAKNTNADRLLEDRYIGELKQGNGGGAYLWLSFSSDSKYLNLLGSWFGEPMHRVIDIKKGQIIYQTKLPFERENLIPNATLPISQRKDIWITPINFFLNSKFKSLIAFIELTPPFDISYLGQDLNDKKFAKNPIAYLQKEPWADLISVVISPSGNNIAGFYKSGIIKIWDGKTSKLLYELDSKAKNEKNDYRYYIELSPTGKYLCLRNTIEKFPVQIWDAKKGKKLHEINLGKRTTEAFFSMDEKSIILMGGALGTEGYCYSLETFKKIDEGKRQDLIKDYNAVYFDIGRIQNMQDINSSISFSFQNGAKTVTLHGKNPQKNWILTTNDGHFFADKEDLPFIHQIDETQIKSVNRNSEQFLDGFLHEAVNSVQEDNAVQFRQDYALLFAAEDYQTGWAKLNNPVFDTEAFAKILKDRYDFKVEVVKNPTQKQILLKLREYNKKVYGKYDQLLVFYSGHGQQDPDYFEEGYLVPVDAGADEDGVDQCIAHQNLFKQLDRMPCPHIILVADACYSGRMAKFGKLLEGNEIIDRNNYQYVNSSDLEYVQKKLITPSRLFLASGNDAVPDGRPGTHTPFMSDLLKALEKGRGEDTFYPFGMLIRELTQKQNKGVTYGYFGKKESKGIFLMEVINRN